MTDVLFPAAAHAGVEPAERQSGLSPVASKALLLIVVAASFAISLHFIGSTTMVRPDANLANLLRFMAALKGLLALAVLVAVFWRLAAPVGPLWLAAYLTASGPMVAGPGLIWGMNHVGLGALLLHGGLFAAAVLLWRDPTTSARLKQIIDARSKKRARLSA